MVPRTSRVFTNLLYEWFYFGPVDKREHDYVGLTAIDGGEGWPIFTSGKTSENASVDLADMSHTIIVNRESKSTENALSVFSKNHTTN
jgi:hypothetical protein